MKGFYGLICTLFSGAVKRLFRVDVEGLEKLPESGGVILAPNHISAWDVIIITACLNRQVRYVAKAELFRIPLVSTFIKAMGAVPIKRGAGDVGAVKKTISMLTDGEVVGFFMQGTRYTGVDPHSSEPKDGIGLIASRTGVPVLPVGLYTKNFRVLPFRKVYLRLGDPVYLNAEDFGEKKLGDFKRIASLLFGRVLELVDGARNGEADK